jgi:uncharacterized protein
MEKSLRVINRTRNTTLVTNGVVADTYWSRFMGLMGKRELADGFGLLLKNESAIHTFGMRLPIDVIYLDAHGNVLRVTPAMPPTRLGPIVRGVRNVLELPAGTLAQTQTQQGDQLLLEFG